MDILPAIGSAEGGRVCPGVGIVSECALAWPGLGIPSGSAVDWPGFDIVSDGALGWPGVGIVCGVAACGALVSFNFGGPVLTPPKVGIPWLRLSYSCEIGVGGRFCDGCSGVGAGAEESAVAGGGAGVSFHGAAAEGTGTAEGAGVGTGVADAAAGRGRAFAFGTNLFFDLSREVRGVIFLSG